MLLNHPREASWCWSQRGWAWKTMIVKWIPLMASVTIVKMLYIGISELIHFKTERLYSLTNISPFPPTSRSWELPFYTITTSAVVVRSTYIWYLKVFVFLYLISFSIIPLRFLHTVKWMNFILLWLNNIPLYIYIIYIYICII